MVTLKNSIKGNKTSNKRTVCYLWILLTSYVNCRYKKWRIKIESYEYKKRLKSKERRIYDCNILIIIKIDYGNKKTTTKINENELEKEEIPNE